jgi:hypothetical protein
MQGEFVSGGGGGSPGQKEKGSESLARPEPRGNEGWSEQNHSTTAVGVAQGQGRLNYDPRC